MKKSAVLFTLAFILGLLPIELKAQGANNSNTFSKEKIASIQKISTLFNKKNVFGIAPHKNIATAANSQVYLIDTAIEYTLTQLIKTDTVMFNYSYNDTGLVTSALAKLLQNGQWTNYTLEKMSWDASKLTLTMLGEFWENGQWTDSTLEIITMNTFTNVSTAHPLTGLTMKWQNGHWADSTSGTWTYDASGNNLTETWEILQNGQWTFYYSESYTYDQNGNQLTALQQYLNGQLTDSSLTTYTYDASGHELTDLYAERDSGQWNNLTLDTYTYNQKGNRIKDLYAYWTNNQWITANYDTLTYVYDANRNIISFTAAAEFQAYPLTPGSALSPTNYSITVADLPNPKSLVGNFNGYNMTISYVLTNITTSVSANKSNIPQTFSLSQNYPNPFNPSTTISFNIPSKSYVSLKIFDMLGREVATIVSGEMPAGSYTSQWNAAKMSSGIYFYRLEAGTFIQTKKLILLK
ncbi:MAG: T9SS type A sorting domain-containing protein [Bacteroidota bacterium]